MNSPGVIRNYSPWGFPKTGVPNEYASTSYGWVIWKVYEDGNPYPIAQEIVLMEYRDSD